MSIPQFDEIAWGWRILIQESEYIPLGSCGHIRTPSLKRGWVLEGCNKSHGKQLRCDFDGEMPCIVDNTSSPSSGPSSNE